MWQDLVKVLEGLTAAYGRLLKIAREKQAALVSLDMKGLEGLLQTEQGIVDEIHRLETERQSVLKRLLKELSLSEADMTMEKIIGVSPSDLRPWLKQSHQRLNDAVSQTTAAGKENEFLIQNALSAVAYHLNRLGHSAVEPAYGEKGQEVVSRRKNFDFRA